MIFPLGTDRPLKSSTRVTYALLAVNVLVFAAQSFLTTTDPDRAAEVLANLMVWRHNFHWWQLFTPTFLHGGIWHLAGNSVFLWAFGPNIEDRFGKLGFFVFYVLGGAAAAGLHMAFSDAPALGASGAIAACTGAYLVLFPKTNIRVVGLIGAFGFFWVKAWWFIGLSIVWDIASQFLRADSGVAHAAHLGGYMFGAAVAYGLLAGRVIPREQYDLFTESKQAYRRKQIRDASKGFDRTVGSRMGAAKVSADEKAAMEALGAARSQVVGFVSAGDFEAALPAYRRLADTYGHLPRATTLSRRHQYEVANEFMRRQEYASAAYAYDRFLEAYPTDPEAPMIRLLLGRIHARYLNDPIRAKALLTQAMESVFDIETRTQARQELEALG